MYLPNENISFNISICFSLQNFYICISLENYYKYLLSVMSYSISVADSVGHSSLIASIASNVWREYYGSLLSGKQIDYMLEKFQSEEAIRSQIDNDGYKYLIIYEHESNGLSTPVGYMCIKYDECKIFLSKFYILKTARGKGAGRAAFDFLLSEGYRTGAESIWLTVNKGNADSISLYKHLGFDIVKEQVADIGEGYVMDDFVMEKIF